MTIVLIPKSLLVTDIAAEDHMKMQESNHLQTKESLEESKPSIPLTL